MHKTNTFWTDSNKNVLSDYGDYGGDYVIVYNCQDSLNCNLKKSEFNICKFFLNISKFKKLHF